MTAITINQDLGGNKAGTTINVTEGTAAQLIANGYAEETAEAPATKPRGKTKSDPADETKGGGPSPEDPATPAG